jgi:hypothetical protein
VRHLNVKSVYPTGFEMIAGVAGHARNRVRFIKDQESGPWTPFHELVNWIRGYMHMSCTAHATTSFASQCCIVWYTGILTLLVIIYSPNDQRDWLSVACQDKVHMTMHNHASPLRLILLEDM